MATFPVPAVGELRWLCTMLARSQVAAGGSGGTGLTEADSTLGTEWARVEGLRGTFSVNGEQVLEGATHRITCRWRADHAAVRFVTDTDGNRYEVLEARDPIGDRQWLAIQAEQVS